MRMGKKKTRKKEQKKKRKWLDWLKRIAGIIAGTVFYFLMFSIIQFVPKAISWGVEFTPFSDQNKMLVRSLAIVLYWFLISSNALYLFLHKRYERWLDASEGKFRSYFLACLISVDDVLVALPKRSFLFSLCLIITILDEFGVETASSLGGANVLFVGVVVLALDTLANSWKKEKKKLFALGEKAYGNKSNIREKIVPKKESEHDEEE